MSNNPTSKKLKFLQLLSNDEAIHENETWQPLSKIEIPIIQRDYAQGREGKEELRKSFLGALYNTVVEEKPLELDFVYGSVKNSVLQPLDGQQRLTTLFLLHWFVAIKENRLDDELKKLLTKFTYETRTSSREFCKDLINKGIDFEKLLETDYHDKDKSKPKNNELSKTIIDSPWFFLSWKRDPTIKSMLTMLNSIQQTFQNKTEVWNKLNNISFHYIELQNFGLSDDLYIKMNARGKPLTDFENFKAKFEQYIGGKKWEEGLPQAETFAYKIDREWTDLFWKHKNEENVFDEHILKFMTGVAILAYAQSLELLDNEQGIVKKELERKITKLFNDYRAIKPEDFVTKEVFEYLKKCFEIYSKNNNDKVNPELTLWDYNKDRNLFSELVDANKLTTYKQRVLFYAQTVYLLRPGFEVNSFAYWMRVVRNIVENATIDSADRFRGAINLIMELSNGCNAVYDFLSENSIQSKFAEEQVKEETRKAKLIANNNEIKQIIFDLEDTSFCKGTINWCLECSEKVEELGKIKEVIDSHLSEDDVSNLFRRALLTIGHNDFYNYWDSWSYSTDTHKRCLIENRNELKNKFTNGDSFNAYLKPLIIQLYNTDLQSVVDIYVPSGDMRNWKIRLIKEAELLDNHCQSHYIGITNDDKQCYLYGRKKRPSSRDECECVE